MILLVDTSNMVCAIDLIDGDWSYHDEWQADHDLAHNFLNYLRQQLEKNKKSWNDIEAIGVYEGPGSFTGLRIGLTVLNTIADSQQIPIVGARSVDWRKKALTRIANHENDKIVLPFYGSDAKITTPRK